MTFGGDAYSPGVVMPLLRRRISPLPFVICAGAFEVWRQNVGPARAGGLAAGYLLAFGLSHPLAKRLGAWPAVVTLTGAVGVAAALLGERPATR